MRIVLRTLGLLLFAGPLAAGDYPPSPTPPAVETPPPPPAGKPFYFIADYLPVAIYDHDYVVGSFRVENTTAAQAQLELTVAACDSAGKPVNEQRHVFTAPPAACGQVQGSQECVGVATIRFAVRKPGPDPAAAGKGAAEVGALTVRLLRDDETWPATGIRAGRLVVPETGEVLIPVVTKRLRKEDRAFAPVKWLLGSSAVARLSGRSVAFIPGRWRLDCAPPPQPVLLGPDQPGGAPPVLCAASQVLSFLRAEQLGQEKKAGPPAGAAAAPLAQLLICLPPEDFDVATDPRVYRKIVEALLAHVAKLRLKRVLLVPPFQYGVSEDYCQSLWREVREAASSYGVVVVDPGDCLDEKLWRADPRLEGVYGIYPNAAGLKKIEQGLLNLVR